VYQPAVACLPRDSADQLDRPGNVCPEALNLYELAFEDDLGHVTQATKPRGTSWSVRQLGRGVVALRLRAWARNPTSNGQTRRGIR
jgi:hypothetical protein